jgi:ketosteroid isomerase-like protein
MAEPGLREMIHAAYAAFNRGNIDAVLDLMHPDVECHPPPTSIDPKPFRGREAVREYLAPNFFENQSAEPVEVLEQDDRIMVVARVRARGRGSGIEIDSLAFHLWTVEDGRATRFAIFVDRDEAFAAFREGSIRRQT